MELSPRDALTEFLIAKEDDAGVRPATLRWYRYAIERFFADTAQPERVSGYKPLHLRQWTAALKARGLKPGAIRSYQGAVWTWLRWLYQQDDYGVSDVTRRVPLYTVRDEDTKRRVLSLRHKREMVLVARLHREWARRDVALIEVLWATGARRSELAACTIDDYDSRAGTLRLRETKMGRPRVVYVGRTARNALEAYIIRERGGREAGPLFYGRMHRPMASGAMCMVIRRLAEACGFEVSAHDFRRACAARLLAEEAPLDVVMHQLGHKSSAMSLMYGASGREARSLSILKKLDEAG